MEETLRETDFILHNQTEFLIHLKSKFTMIHNSNFFFRDLHYGIISYMKDHRLKSTYRLTEIIATEVSIALVNNGIFKQIDHQSWVLNYPDFTLPRVEKIVV